jgi:hypothetical protein
MISLSLSFSFFISRGQSPRGINPLSPPLRGEGINPLSPPLRGEGIYIFILSLFLFHENITQLVEYSPFKRRVISSNLIILKTHLMIFLFSLFSKKNKDTVVYISNTGLLYTYFGSVL